MPATIEGFESFMGALGGLDTGYDPNADYSDTSAFDNAIDTGGGYEATDFTLPETSGYVNEALGIGPAEYGPDGRIVNDDQLKQARYSALGNVLTAAAKSLLNANPNYVVDGASEAGEKYKQDLDAAHARNISARTLKFHEAQVKMALETGSITNTNNKMILKKMERDLKNEEIMRRNIGVAAKPINNIISEQIDATVASGAWGDPKDPGVKLRAETEKGKLPLISAYYQAGFADKAIALQAEVQSSLPAYAQQNVSAKIKSLMDTYTAFQSMPEEERAAFEFDPTTGGLINKADKQLERDRTSAQIGASRAAEAAGYAQAEESKAGAAYKRGLTDGSIDAGMSPGDASRIRGAGEDWNEALRTEVNGPMFTSSGKLPRESKLNKYLGPLLDDPNINQVVLMEVIKNSPNPGLALDAIAASGGRMPEQMKELYDDYFDMYKKSLVSGRERSVGLKFAPTGPNNLPRGVR